jgi:hypothetical protein
MRNIEVQERLHTDILRLYAQRRETAASDALDEIDKILGAYLKEAANELDKRYLCQYVAKHCVLIAIDHHCSHDVVAQIYGQSAAVGFTDEISRVTVNMEYAEYCGRTGHVKEGLKLLEELRSHVAAGESRASSKFRRASLQRIDEAICRLKTDE